MAGPKISVLNIGGQTAEFSVYDPDVAQAAAEALQAISDRVQTDRSFSRSERRQVAAHYGAIVLGLGTAAERMRSGEGEWRYTLGQWMLPGDFELGRLRALVVNTATEQGLVEVGDVAIAPVTLEGFNALQIARAVGQQSLPGEVVVQHGGEVRQVAPASFTPQPQQAAA